MEQKQLFGALTVYRSRGAYLRGLEQFDKSIAAYNEAIQSVPDGMDVKTLKGRSESCAFAMKPQQAYADAELALSFDPKNMESLKLQASANYTMSEFERSIIMNCRGNRHRRQPSYFRNGVQIGIQTLEDCVGENAGDVMLDFLPLIKQTDATRLDENEPSGSLHVSRIPKPKSEKRLTQMQVRKHNILARVMAMKYFGAMAYDKFFLQDLLADTCLESANAGGTVKLKEIISEALETLTARQKLLRSARPYYTIKVAERSTSKHQNKFKENLLIKEREVGARTAERLLRDIEKSCREHRIKDVIMKAERMQLFLDNKTVRTLPDKEHYIDRLYRQVGEAYLIQHRLSYTHTEQSNKRRVAFLMGLPVGRSRSYDSVIANYPFKFMDVKRATQNVIETLHMCENSMMKCWLKYELACLLCKQKNFALGKFYAKRCQGEAQKIGSITWWFNACFVLISGDMQQGNANEVKIQVEEAYEWAKQKIDSEQAQSFLSKCADMASETMATDDRKAVNERQKHIVKMMPPEMKTETEVLFKRISMVPAGRQISVLPKKPGPPDDRPERQRQRQRGLTIIPGEPKPLPPLPRTKTPGFQVFEP